MRSSCSSISSASRFRRRPGFTLIELLVAMAVLCILVVTLFAVVDSATKLWRQNENRVDAFREARAALAVITRDLNSLCASTNVGYFSTNAVGNKANGADVNGLYFLTLMSPSAQPAGNRSDICTVGYYRRWTRQNDGFGQTNASDPTVNGYHLFRSLYGSDLTYSNLLTGTPPLNDLQVPPNGGVDPEILARNILGVEFVCYTANAAYQTNASATAYSKWTYSPNTPIPQMIEVRLTAIPDETAKRLQGSQGRWTTNDPLVAKDFRTFVSRVMIPPVNQN